MNKTLKVLLFSVCGIAALVVLVPLLVMTTGIIKISDLDLLLNGITGAGIETPDEDALQARLSLPDGYRISLYQGDLPMVRMLALSAAGDLLASRPRVGEVLLLKRDADSDGKPDAVITLLSGLEKPHGLALAGDWLYIAESNAIGRVGFDAAAAELRGDYHHIITGLDDSGNHWTKTIGVGPDGWLYISSGSTCNACEEQDKQRATIMRSRLDGSDLETYATGLRNSVGFDWAPWSGALYATDNGRDLLGDDTPVCVLNRVEQGGFYGWPYINGFDEPDRSLKADEQTLSAAIAPVHGFAAHNAPLGIRFVTLPHAAGERSALVALHGAWNRTVPDGYKVVQLNWQADDSIVQRDFVAGFYDGDTISGRPVDIVQDQSGVIFVSDDYAGAIYRIGYGETVGNVSPAGSLATNVQPGPLANINPAELARLTEKGRALFAINDCGRCHFAGAARKLDLSGLSASGDIAGVVAAINTPTPPMPLYKLAPGEARALAVYLLGPPQQQSP